MKLFEKFMYPLLVIFLFFANYFARTNLSYFESTLVAEDGFFQWMTFYTILFASIMCFYRASILKPFRGPIFAACLVISGLVFLIFALDEISWGQRIFEFKSPLFFETYNTHHQVNIHHLVIGGFYVNNIIFTLAIKILATLYFLILPFLYTKRDRIKKVVNKYAIPLPRYTHAGAYLVLSILVNLIPSEFKYVIFEFGFYWILVLMMYNPINDEIFSRRSLVR